MIPYLWLFAMVAAMALGETRWRMPPARQAAAWWGFGGLLVLMIGLRDQVGGDWDTYLGMFHVMGRAPLALMLDDRAAAYNKSPGYFVLNWLVGRGGGGIYLVNTVCAGVFVAGLMAFCRQQPRPWLALVVAVPYLVIVVGMGYTRQAVAIGLAMGGLAGLAEGRLWRFCGCVLLATLFHRSAMIVALLLLPVVFATPRHWKLGLAFAGVLLAGYVLLMPHAVPWYVARYLGRGTMTSSGTNVRVAMNVGAALVLLAHARRLGVPPGQLALWRTVAWSMLALAPALILVPSSTAVDRLALFWLPLQVLTLSRLPLLAGDPGTRGAALATGAVVAGCGLVLVVWLGFAASSAYWLPYRFYPLVAWQR